MSLITAIRRFFDGVDTREAADPSALLESGGSVAVSLDLKDELLRAEVGPPWWESPVQPAGRAEERPRPIDRRLLEELVAALESPDVELPQLPEITARVLASLRENGGDMRRAAQFAERDEKLSGEFLRIANAAAFRGICTITRLDAAFVRLGEKRVRSVLLAATLKRLAVDSSRSYPGLGEELWLSFWASGLILAEFGRRFGLAEDDAFLLGLLHDIGRLGVLKVIQDFQTASGVSIPRRLFDQLARRWHERQGRRIAEAWGLPAPLPEVIGGHHEDPLPGDPLARERRLVQLSEAICALLGYVPAEPFRFFELPCVRVLGLRDTPETHHLLRPLPELLKQRMQL